MLDSKLFKSNIIKIKGVHKLNDVSYNIMPDRIEAGTFLVAGAITGGKIKLNNVNLFFIIFFPNNIKLF